MQSTSWMPWMDYVREFRSSLLQLDVAFLVLEKLEENNNRGNKLIPS